MIHLLQQYEQELEEESERTNKYVQRDLEDQIEEEYRAQGREYQRTDTKKSSNMSASTRPEIVVQDVLDLLKKGYTRLKKDDLGYGSIQEYYQLTSGEVKELFMHTKLRMKKTMPPKRGFTIVDRESAEVQYVETDPTDPPERYPGTVEAPIQDVVVTSTVTEVPEPVVNSTSREQLFS